MNHTFRLAIVAVTACLAPVAGHCDPATLDDVFDADQEFAAVASDQGTQAAFQQFLADDGVLFRPTAVTGQDWLRTHEAATGRLDWSPTAGAISCDGGTAFTLGPWTYRQQDDVATGYYLTVWRADSSGRWQVVLDHGIDLTQPATPVDVAAARRLLAAHWPEARSCGTDAKSTALDEADRALNATMAVQGPDAALRSLRDGQVLAMRDEHPPAPVSADWPGDTAAGGADLVATTTRAVAAPGADVGYSYGELRSRPASRSPSSSAGEVRAVYVRVWQRTADGWKLAVDLSTALPQGSSDAATTPARSAAPTPQEATITDGH